MTTQVSQKKYISNLCKQNPKAVIVSSLGTCSYDLKEIEHKNKILVKGAMGHATAVGLGYALGSEKKVIVIIGDGSFLMRMGTMSTILEYAPKDFEVHILNNNCYKSCGGQETNFRKVQSYAKKYKNFYVEEVS